MYLATAILAWGLLIIPESFVKCASVIKRPGPGTTDRGVASNNDNGPPPGWNFIGCFDDTDGIRTPATPNATETRTLKAQSLVDPTGMTPARCMQFCSDFQFPYGFAGVEQGTQCWCDGVIQLNANQTDINDCNTPCVGDPTLTCGGTNRIAVFTNGTPSPKIPTLAYQHVPNEDAAFVPLWEYIGCYSDNFVNRTLPNLLPNVANLDANTCVTACENAFPFSTNVNPRTLLYAGVEAGTQCWCGTSLATTAQKLPDIACESKGCLGVNDQACGGISAIEVYQLNPLQLQGCAIPGTILNFRTPFQLNIRFFDGEPTVPVTMASINTHTNFGTSTRDAGILSYCPTCPDPIIFELDTDSQWELRLVNFSNPTINEDVNSVIHPGGMVNLVEVSDDDPVFTGYCGAPSPFNPAVAQLTAFAAHEAPPIIAAFNPKNFISFSLCSNVTAGGRFDIVYRPLTLMPNLYNLTGCKDVILEIDYNVTVPVGVGLL